MSGAEAICLGREGITMCAGLGNVGYSAETLLFDFSIPTGTKRTNSVAVSRSAGRYDQEWMQIRTVCVKFVTIRDHSCKT